MTTESPEAAPQVTTAAGWMRQAVHTVTLPSGATVKIRIPDISALIKTGQIPQHLLSEALASAKRLSAADAEPEAPTAEAMAKEVEFKNLVVKATVVDPKITDALLDPDTGMPTEDKEKIVEFAMRQSEFDAIGNHIGGLHTHKQFRAFRGLGSLYEDVEGLPGS